MPTDGNTRAKIKSLLQAWEWSAADGIPMFLPLHHIHGIMLIVDCALWSGALVEPFARFEMNAILDRVRSDAYTLFMAVPTIYVKLIQALVASSERDRAAPVACFKTSRRLLRCIAAFPAHGHMQWTAVSGPEVCGIFLPS